MDSVGERIKQLRISKGITQAELAASIGTTKGVISRYEQGKREIRFAQAQGIADFLGISVFALYGVPSEKQVWMEHSQRFLAKLKEQIQHNLDENPDKIVPEINAALQTEADKIEKELQTEINLATLTHKAQVAAALISQQDEAKSPTESPQADPAVKLQNKRVDDLVNMFSAYPRDAQNRILDIVSTFGQLNSIGQKRALGRVKELTEVPRYQAQQEDEASG